MSEVIPPLFTPAMRAPYHAVGDIDGDGDVDIVLSGMWLLSMGADRPYVYLNDGTGHFSIDWTRFPRAPALRGFTQLVDVERDGDLDVVFGGEGLLGSLGGVELWLNDGRGYFTDVTSTRIPAGTVTSEGLVAGDLDADGYPDIVIGRNAAGTTAKRILWNDRTGNFTVQALPPNDEVRQIFVVDVDLDGDNDLFIKGGFGRLFLNDRGTLTQVPFPTHNPLWDEARAAVGDVNVDGYPDIVFSYSGPGSDPTIFLNDRHGHFVDTPGWFHGDWHVGLDWMAFADVDGDGDEDLYAAGLWAPPFYPPGRGAVLFNLWRQVWGLPVAQLASTYRLEVCGRPGTVFAVALAALRNGTPVHVGPLGLWHLDPASSVWLGTVAMGVGGRTSLPISIPNLPFLRGKTFYSQAVDLGDGTHPEHATGWWPVTVQ